MGSEIDIGLFSDAVDTTRDAAKLSVICPHAPKNEPPLAVMLPASLPWSIHNTPTSLSPRVTNQAFPVMSLNRK